MFVAGSPLFSPDRSAPDSPTVTRPACVQAGARAAVASPTPRRATRPLLLAALALLAALPALAAERTRTFTESFPTGSRVRLANLAGEVEIVPGSGGAIEVEVRVHAEGRNDAETERLLAGMRFVDASDRDGRPEKALAYPVDDYDGFYYPRLLGRDPGFLERLFAGLSQTQTRYRGERVAVYGGRGTPVLYADLTVRLPADADLVLRNLVGEVTGGKLAGRLRVDTGSGDVRIAAFAGDLEVDTGSGEVELGSVEGSLLADTGSGGIQVANLVGSGVLDTGSGRVRVEKVDSDRLEIDTGSGGISVANGRVGTLLADTGSGGIDVRRVEIERFVGDTGSGGVTLESSLLGAREVTIDTGSGSVDILASRDASFDLHAERGSGGLYVGYDDATLEKQGKELVGARRGDGATVIRVDTGSGSVEIRPVG
jgi:hypothetical protein